jgi:hypothetical protein
MSWSLDAVIKTGGDDVVGKVKSKFDAINLNNAEERLIKDIICQAALAAIAGCTSGQYVKLEASGSASSDSSRGFASQSCRLSVQPIYGAVID